ncbi:MAG: PQQ-binding-like beta-propeller repeat protein [Verrucomicrobiales bacterium]
MERRHAAPRHRQPDPPSRQTLRHQQHGVLNEADAKSGDRGWRIRMEGPFSGSPVASGDFLYAVSEGLVQIVDLRGEEGKVVSTLDLGETILTTPSLVGGAIYVRSDGHLWKLK